jgi:site-specific DNA-adenine methylase
MKALSVCGYPGGKVKAVPYLLSRFPKPITEFRDIFCGGGSVSLAVIQRYPEARFWMNDLHYPVYAFWKTLRERPYEMVRWLLRMETDYAGRLRELFDFCKGTIEGSDEFETACKWWAGQKLGYSGFGLTTGSYSVMNGGKFNARQIIHLLDVASILRAVNLTITNVSYENCLGAGFVFADPPYLIPHDSLYGYYGKLHRTFDHQAFALRMKSHAEPWLVTYNDNDRIRGWFADFNMEPLDLTYTLRSKRTGYELIITNYDTVRSAKKPQCRAKN